jgi:flagellar assembly protein FliH
MAQPMEWRTVGAPVRPAAQAGTGNRGLSSGDAAQMVVAQQRRIQELEHELDQRTRECYQQGVAAGRSTGEQQAQQQLEPVMARLAQSIGEFTGLRRRVRSEGEEDVVRLAVAVSRKILHREITVDSESLLGLVKAAMQRVDARELHRVRMHPDDIPMLERSLEAVGMPARLEVLADPSLERGGLVLETARGNLDASVETQLGEIERGFIYLVKRRRDA